MSFDNARTAAKWLRDPANLEEAVAVVADFTKQPKRRPGALFTPNGDYYRDPNGLPDINALQSNIDTAYHLGFLKAQPTVAPFAELGPMKEAGRVARGHKALLRGCDRLRPRKLGAACTVSDIQNTRLKEHVMANTVFVSDETVQQVLDWKEMVDKLAEAHAADLHADFAPPRTMARGLTGEWTRALCAVPAGPIMGTKFFALAAKGGGIRYCIALFQKTDSELVALVDANTVTARRTAGATAVALDKLAPNKPLSVGILGSGHEASAHVNAIGTRRAFTSIKVFSPTVANREAFAAKFAKQLGIPCTAVGTPREAVEGADMVLATTSTRGGEPSLKGEYLTNGQCIGAIGSTLPEQWECDPVAMEKADLIVCDNAEEVQHGTGDFINARKAGVKFDGKVFDLPDLVKGKLDAKVKAAGITMYRSAGTGLQDVVVAELAWRRAMEKGLAVELPMQLFHKTSGAGGRASPSSRR